jgi:DNA-binding MurR/RpiR family transcriptional regulator
MTKDLFSQIGSLEADLKPQQKKVADYFLSHLQELPFQTASEISRESGVSEPTIIRFVRLLGYKGFIDFRNQLQRKFKEEILPSERIQGVFGINKNIENIANSMLELEIHNLRETLKGIDLGQLEEIVRAIIAARMNYIIGLRTSSGAAYVLGRILSHILPNVVTILDGDIRMYEKLRAIGKQDVLITISYPRYLKNTGEAIQFVKLRKATTIAITDSKLSPTAQISTYDIIAPSNSQTLINSYTACLFVINLLTAAIMKIHSGKKMKAVLKEWEKSIDPSLFYNKKDKNSPM